MKTRALMAATAVACLSATAALAGGHGGAGPFVRNSLTVTYYPGDPAGDTNDLLSAGLGAAGLQAGAAPAFADPLDPTVDELRRMAIHGNYAGVVDKASAGGYGTFWGPGYGGRPEYVPGYEYKAGFMADNTAGYINNITMVVQIPDSFDAEAKRCIVMVPPSGSRGVYGGIAVGEWGLYEGCAVALGGKGSGTGYHLLSEENAAYAVDDIDGITGSVDEIGREAQFRVLDNAHLRRFKAEYPDRFATKHAHSQISPERLWGDFALRSVEFAFWALNDRFDTAPGKSGEVARFTPENTIVIAAGVSNGAGAAVHALEVDTKGLIDGLVVSEPSMNPGKGDFVIEFGDDDPFDPEGQTLYDSIAMMGVYAGCAALDASLVGTPLNIEPLGSPAGSRLARCASLHDAGLLTDANPANWPAEALGFLNAHGYYPEENWGVPAIEALNFWRTLNVTYGGSYGRFAVWDHICGVSYGLSDPVTGSPVPFSETAAKALFATSSGIPTTMIADDAVNGPIAEDLAISSFGRQDLNLDGALCFRYLSTGDPYDLGRAPTARDRHDHARVVRGGLELQADGDMHGKPAIIIHGRQDSLVFPNFQSRAYYALNQEVEGAGSDLSYWEVTPAQHFDTFISSFFVDPGSGETLFVPLHYYLTEGLDMMMAHLNGGGALPPSQVIRAAPYETAATPYVVGDPRLPAPSASPGSDAITFADGVLTIPD